MGGEHPMNSTLMGHIVVGIHQVEVHAVKNPKLKDEPVDGFFDPETLVININVDMPASKKRETLMHEALHVGWWFGQLWKLKNPDEETCVSALGASMSEILARNPWISEYVEAR